MQVQLWGYHEVAGTLKPCIMQKNLFELFALTDSGTQKFRVRALAPEPPGETCTIFFDVHSFIMAHLYYRTGTRVRTRIPIPFL